MSFQAYLDNAEQQTGITPRAFLALAAEKNLTKHGEVVTWLKTEHGLGHGHATAIARLVTKGPDFVAEHHTGGVLHLDGLAARS
ncbi:DUF4287 domain-containing protein [Amycolatopsis australiensis]|uniref:DUF4287 domain-containing protein n=1 Tax=Amycolatopsis australiensis TaxID=546364 RepID=A0A1K1S6G7_9PSEU|nr:DUF4287 domain-containing protein [Amycolatopsis australiensis]SFW79660.1 protein of unknown function [Amycolatopsis australiensis]